MISIPPGVQQLVSRSLVPVVLTGAIGLVSGWYLWPAPAELPMDDAYIHFVYAQNLVEQGRLMFNSPGEVGVGTTSPLWVLLLAAGRTAGLSMALAAKVLGLASLVWVGIGFHLLLRPFGRPLLSLAAPAAVVLSGHMVWFALSGMETTLFLAIGVLALLAYRHRRWGWVGVLLGLLALTRPEGLALGAAIGAVELWQFKHFKRGWVRAAALSLLVCGAWFGYLMWRTGHLLPTSGLGRQGTFAIARHAVLGGSEALALLEQLPPVTYVGAWLVYVLEFVLGGIALPAPRLSVATIFGTLHYDLSVWAILGWVGVILPLAWAAVRTFGARRNWNRWAADDMCQPLVALAAWVVLHNLGYMLLLPIPGTASRYGALNHIALWLGLLVGLSALWRVRAARWLAAGLAVIAIFNTAYWNTVYDANLEHMRRVRIAAARFVRTELGPEQHCAAFDIGAMRYFSGRPILDLGGLIDPGLGRYFASGHMDLYLVENEINCLILPGRIGREDDGWFDLAALMGLTDSPLFALQPYRVFSIDQDLWLLGYLPTNHYQATATIYRLTAPGARSPTGDMESSP